MESHFELAAVKGAPLSILVFLTMNGNRAVSVSELAAETGFSEKPIRKGLRDLQCLGMVVSPRVNRYQLTGQEYQLPLSWGEKVLPSGDSPDLTGVFPGKAGVSPELERRVLRLEAAVFGASEDDGDSPMKGQSEMPGDSPLIEEEGGENLPDIEVIPGEEWSGNFPGKLDPFNKTDGNRQKSAGSSVIRGQWASGDSAGKAGVSPEKTGDIPDGLINNINNTQDKEVSKKEGNDTYLLSNMSNEQGLTAVAGGQGSGTRDQWSVASGQWSAAMEQLKGSMSASSFGTFLRDAEVIGYEDGHYTVAVKNQMVRDWLDVRIRDQVERMLSVISGEERSVSFVVHEAVAGGQELVVKDHLHFAGHAAYHNVHEVETEPELLPESGDPGEGPLVEICNEYLLDPAGMDYSLDEMAELVAMHPDPRVLRWILPKATKFENAKSWCRCDFVKAKWKVLGKYDIGGPARKEFADNDEVSLELIERWCGEFCPDDPGLAVKRIREFAGKEMEI